MKDDKGRTGARYYTGHPFGQTTVGPIPGICPIFRAARRSGKGQEPGFWNPATARPGHYVLLRNSDTVPMPHTLTGGLRLSSPSPAFFA